MQYVHLTTLGVGGQQCCVRLHGALVTGAECTRPSELSWFLHYKHIIITTKGWRHFG